MTTPVPPNAVSLSDATAVLMSDGQWVVLQPGTPLTVEISPMFTDPTTGELIAPGEAWFQFQSTASVTYACPAHGIMAVQLSAPVVE